MNLRLSRFFQGLKALKNQEEVYDYNYKEKIVYSCRVEEWKKQFFQADYPFISIEELILEFNEVLSLPGELLGKRSSQVALSVSRKYCIKVIDEESLKKYEQIFQQIEQFQKDKEVDFLIDIYRVFIIYSEEKQTNHSYKDIIVLMPCLRGPVEQIINVYDLKGYTEGRRLNHDEYIDFRFGKDENFVECKELEIIQKIPKDRKELFIEKFTKNVEFLKNKNIIDYSLLICFESSDSKKINSKKIKMIDIEDGITIKWAIIDYFQEYNRKKRVQNKFKALFRKEISSVEPDIYAKRFIQFIKKYFQ